MLDPNDREKGSQIKVLQALHKMEFEKPLYKHSGVEMPKLVFLPSENLARIFIRANCRHSKTDSLQKFLLRFGLVENLSWYLDKEKTIFSN